jgi:hypothetical protein
MWSCAKVNEELEDEVEQRKTQTFSISCSWMFERVTLDFLCAHVYNKPAPLRAPLAFA